MFGAKSRKMLCFPCKLQYLYSTCITLQAHRPRTCLQNWCCLCTPDCCRAWALPCRHQDENPEYTASFRLPFPLRKCSQLYSIIHTQSVGFTLCINIICPMQGGSVAHTPAPHSQKNIPPSEMECQPLCCKKSVTFGSNE